jgi:hypothetical protein
MKNFTLLQEGDVCEGGSNMVRSLAVELPDVIHLWFLDPLGISQRPCLSTITSRSGTTASVIQSGLAITLQAVRVSIEQAALPSPAGLSHVGWSCPQWTGGTSQQSLFTSLQSLFLSHQSLVTGPQSLAIHRRRSMVDDSLDVSQLPVFFQLKRCS